MRRFSKASSNRNLVSRFASPRSTRRRLGIDRLEARLMFAAQPIPGLSDEFNDPASAADWQRIHEVEGWGADQLNLYDIDATQAGRMVQQPHTTVWYQDWRGPLAFKNVTGDFVFTTQVHITDRDDVGSSDGDDVPADGQFSLAGAMIRTPRPITDPALDWSPGSMADDGTNNGENYIFLSLGYGNGANEFSLEVKSTRNSNSQLELTPLGTGASTATVQIARIGNSIITLYQLPGQEWQVHRRYTRPDMPATLQVGLVTYTDWNKASDFDPFVQNGTVLEPGIGVDPTPGEPFNPDLTAGFEYARYAQPDVPAALSGANLADPFAVSDAELLGFLGANANLETPPDDEQPEPPADGTRVGVNLSTMTDWDPMWVFKDAFKRARPWVPRAINVDTGETTWQSMIGDGPALAVDADGWVTELQTWVSANGNTYQQQASTVLFSEGANQPAGIYRAEWDGDGELAMNFVVESGTTPEGRHYALIDMPAGAAFNLQINSTDPANPIRNINVWMPDYEGQSMVSAPWTPGSADSPFHPLFVDRLDDFDTLRFMMLQSTVDTDIVDWNDRREYDHATQSDGDLVQYFHTSGLSPELMIELANATNTNPWFNMPHEADDEFISNFAAMVRDTLDPELTVYVEWSNELWNAAFPTYSWLQQQMGLPENAGMDFFQVAGQEIARDFEIWSDVFAGQEDRLVRVVAGQQANAWVTEQIVANVNGQVDAISASAYAGISFEMSAGYDSNTTADDIIDDLLEVSIPWAADRLEEHEELVEQFEAMLGRDLLFVTYEGGSHVMGYPNDFVGSGAENAALEAMHSPRMYDVYMALLGVAREANVDLYTEYTFTSRDNANFFGSYGLLQDMTTPIEDAHQLRALLDFAGETDVEGPLVAFQISILDAAGDPITQVEVGQSFTIEVTVDDLRPNGSGVFSAFLDVAYDGSLASPDSEPLFGEAYANAQDGSTAVGGLIDDIGGVASTEELGGDPLLVFSITMTATATGEVVFQGDPGDLLPDHEITLYGLPAPIDTDFISYGNARLTVVPAILPVVAVNDSFTMLNDAQPVILDVLANDDQPGEADAVEIIAVSSVVGGTAVIDVGGDRILFTPISGFYGETSLEYTIRDAHGQEASATAEVAVHKRWTNPLSATDVNSDGHTSPIDALSVINALIHFGLRSLPAIPTGLIGNLPYVDANSDGQLTPADALVVINELTRRARERRGLGGEGESATAAAETVDEAATTKGSTEDLRPVLYLPPTGLPSQIAQRRLLSPKRVDDAFSGSDLDDIIDFCDVDWASHV